MGVVVDRAIWYLSTKRQTGHMVADKSFVFEMETTAAPHSSRQKKQSVTSGAITFVSNHIHISIIESHISCCLTSAFKIVSASFTIML